MIENYRMLITKNNSAKKIDLDELVSSLNEKQFSSQKYNPIHLCIIHNRPDLISKLFNEFFYLPEVKEPVIPYLSLLAICFNPTLFSSLKSLMIEERLFFNVYKGDKKCEDEKWIHYLENILEEENHKKTLNMFHNSWLLTFSQESKKNCPLEVASLCQNSDYVSYLIKKLEENENMESFDYKKLFEISLRIPMSFAFLLSSSSQIIIDSAFKYFLNEFNVTGVEIILKLRKKGHIKVSLLKTNPFNVLFKSQKSILKRNHHLLFYLVNLLIENGFNVNCKSNRGTFPLYSFLENFIRQHNTNNRVLFEHHFKVLKILLEKGADPNYDESEGLVYGDLHSSALSCYFFHLSQCETISSNSSQTLDNVCLYLLENGADASSSHKDLPPLHSLMRTVASVHAHGILSTDFSFMTRLLLYFGANPNLQVLNNNSFMTPFHLYYHTIFDLMGGQIALNRWAESEGSFHASILLNFMKKNQANKDVQQVLKKMCLEPDASKHLETFRTSFKDYNSSVMTLQNISLLTLWVACERKVFRVKKLDLPRKLFEEMTNFFQLDI